MATQCPKCQFENASDSKFCKECGTHLLAAEEISVTKTLETPVEQLTSGTILANRYEIIEELGKGGMGRVYKVNDIEIKEWVALKLLKPEIASDDNTIERFRHELKIARKVSHKHVCRMHDIGREEDKFFITMEYVEGEDLKSHIRKKEQLSKEDAIGIAKQICEGLVEAHRLGVVHRDLKPQNIMIDTQGDAKIMDFGIARSLEAKGVTATGVIIGTPDYISPEQAEGEEADQRSDIYSLGVVLYEMVTGGVPFKGDTAFSVALKHKTKLPQDPRKLNPEISEDLSRLILICMEKDRKRRYQTAAELLADLRNIEEGLPPGTKIRPRRETFGIGLIRRKLFIPALFIVLVIILVIIWRPWSPEKVAPISTDRPSLAVIYFENNTGDDSLDHWRKMLSDMLITDLSQSKHLRVLSGGRIYEILRELNQLEARTYGLDVLQKVAEKGRVDHLLLGKYAKLGETFRIDIQLLDASTGEILASERADASGENEVFPKVDELTPKIKANLNLAEEQIATDIDEDIGKITTSSHEAYKHYIEGRRYLREGNDRQSIESMKKAVAIDPEFAMAYRSMGASYGNLGYGPERRKVLQKALELSDRVSIRERYSILGYTENSVEKKIEAYRKLLELYPEDKIGNNQLGLIYLAFEQWDKAIERYEVNIKQKTDYWGSYKNQAEAYMAKGLYDKAKKVLEYYLNNFSENAKIHLNLAYNYLFQGKYNLALGETDKAFFLNPTTYQIIWIKGDIYLCQWDLNRAEEEYKKLLEFEEQRAHLRSRDRLGILYLLQGKFEESKDQVKQGIELAKRLGSRSQESNFHLQLAYLHLKSGNLEEALEECERAMIGYVESPWYLYIQIDQLHRKGHAYLEKRSLDEAHQIAKEIKESIEKLIHKQLIRYYYHLIGMTELKRENFSEAIEYFKKALSLISSQYNIYGTIYCDNHALFIEPLALAYYNIGNIEKAREEYEKITNLTTGRLYYGDIYAKSFYMLGKIYEQQGDIAKAIEHYEKFLTLWKDADPGIAEVEDARERLAGLK